MHVHCMWHVHVACDTSCALEGLTARLLQVCCARHGVQHRLRVLRRCAACVLHGVLLGGARLLGATQWATKERSPAACRTALQRAHIETHG